MKKTFKVVMLPTEKSNITLGIGSNSTKDKLHFSNIAFDKGKNNQPQHLYILSDDEIKEGDWIYNPNNGGTVFIANDFEISKRAELNRTAYKDGTLKIVATTDKSILIEESKEWKTPYSTGFPKIPESFIQAYIKAYNEDKPITEVDLEMIIVGASTTDGAIVDIKTRPDNTVIVHQSKMYSRDELERLCIKAYKDGFYSDSIHGKHGSQDENVKSDKWIQDNL